MQLTAGDMVENEGLNHEETKLPSKNKIHKVQGLYLQKCLFVMGDNRVNVKDCTIAM